MRNIPSPMGKYRGFSSGYPIVVSFSQYITSVPRTTCTPTVTPLGLGGTGRAPTHGVSHSWAWEDHTAHPHGRQWQHGLPAWPAEHRGPPREGSWPISHGIVWPPGYTYRQCRVASLPP